MPATLDTRQLPRVDRIAAAAAFLENIDMPSRLAFDSDEHLGHRFTGWRLAGGAEVLDVEGSGLHVTRNARHVRASAAERLCLAVQSAGEGTSQHMGVTTVTLPGHLNLIDATSESDYQWKGFAMRRVLLVDYAALGLRVDLVRAAVGRLPASPLYHLVRSHLNSLRPGHEELRATVPGAALAAASIELVRALVATAAEPSSPQEANAHDILRMRVVDYIERHIFDAELSAQKIARAHNISVRQLYVIWSVNSVPLREWIIRVRLERARRQLSTQTSLPVATVAARCGFANATHFARRFHDTYGIRPGEWRRQFAPF
jgi:AraC-like DNA-binding protein